MSEKRTIDYSLIEKMRENNAFRVDVFRLHDGFAGEYTVEKAVATKTRNSDEENSFNVHCKSDKGRAVISGFQIANARILASADIKATPVSDKAAGIYFQDDLKDE